MERLSLQLEFNGELRQDGDYDMMMHKPGQVQAGDLFVGRILSDGRILVSQEWQTE